MERIPSVYLGLNRMDESRIEAKKRSTICLIEILFVCLIGSFPVALIRVRRENSASTVNGTVLVYTVSAIRSTVLVPANQVTLFPFDI